MKLNNKRNKTIYSNQKGITLIALVITIVVLLILAGVSINAIFSENGIINKAKDAQNKMDQATQNDLDSIDGLSNWIDSQAHGTTGVKVVGKEGSLLAMYQKAQKETCDNADGACKDATHLHIGDYVDYKNPTSGTVNIESAESGKYGNNSVNVTQTYILSTTKNNVKWRVLGIDRETGGLKLIAATPLEREENADLLTAVNSKEDGSLHLYGAEAYVYGPTIMNRVSAMYLNSKYATKARSVIIEDINEITGVTTEERIKEVNALPAIFSELEKQYGVAYSFEKQYTPELWLKIGKEKDETQTTTISGNVTGYGYCINYTNPDIPSVKMTNTRAYDLILKGADTKPYWLASRGIRAREDGVWYDVGMVSISNDITIPNLINDWALFWAIFESNNPRDNCGGELAVRPVVILKTDVMAEAMPKIADPT